MSVAKIIYNVFKKIGIYNNYIEQCIKYLTKM